MGRLRKAKIDEIVRLRNDGYTQQETAERARVDLKTVRKYDPLKQPKHVALSLDERVRYLEHLVYYIVGAVDRQDNPLECPRCEIELVLAEGRETEATRADPSIATWACPKCGFFLDTYGRIDPKSIRRVDLETDKPLRSPLRPARRPRRSTGRKKR